MFRWHYRNKYVFIMLALLLCISSAAVVNTAASAEVRQSTIHYLAERWSHAVEGGVAADPVIGADGTVYILSSKGKVYAFTSSGKVKWSVDVHPMDTATGKKGQIELGQEGTLYVCSGGNLYAFGLDGAKKWEYETPGGSFQAAAIQRNGMIYILKGRFGPLLILRPDGTKASERADVSYLVKHAGAEKDTIYVISSKRTISGTSDKPVDESVFYAEEMSLSGFSLSKVKLDKGFVYNTPSTDKQGNLVIPVQSAPQSQAFSVLQRTASEVLVAGGGSIKRRYALTGRTEIPVLFDEQQNAYIVTKDAAVSKFDGQGKLLWSLQTDKRSDVLEHGSTLLQEPNGNLAFYSSLSRIRNMNGFEFDDAPKQQLFKVSPDGKLLSASKGGGYFGRVHRIEKGMMLSHGLNAVLLTDMNFSQLADYTMDSQFYMVSRDSKTIYAGTESGRVIALEMKKVLSSGQAISIAFEHLNREFEAGTTYMLQAAVRRANGKKEVNPDGIVYRSSDERIAYFDDKGLHAVGEGEVELSAQVFHLTARMKVKVLRKAASLNPSATYEARAVKKWELALTVLTSGKDGVYQAPWISPDGMIYAMSNQGKLVAVDADGKIKWQEHLNQPFAASPIFWRNGRLGEPSIGPDGRLYIGTEKGMLAAFDAASGEKLLNKTAASGYRSTMLGWNREGVRYTGFTSGRIKSSSKLWTYTTLLYATDAAEAQLWTASLSGEMTHRKPIFNANQDTMYIVATNDEAASEPTAGRSGGVLIRKIGTLYAVNTATGSVRWNYSLGSSNLTYFEPLVLKDGSVAVANTEGMVQAVDSSGALKWKKNLKTAIQAAPFIENKKVMVVTKGSGAVQPEIDENVWLLEIKGELQSVSRLQGETLLAVYVTSPVNGNKLKTEHSIVSYDAANSKKWQTPVFGVNLYVSEITDDLQVAAIHRDTGMLVLYDIQLTSNINNTKLVS